MIAFGDEARHPAAGGHRLRRRARPAAGRDRRPALLASATATAGCSRWWPAPPGCSALGVDEDTAAVVRGGHLLEVVGAGCVFVADGSGCGHRRPHGRARRAPAGVRCRGAHAARRGPGSTWPRPASGRLPGGAPGPPARRAGPRRTAVSTAEPRPRRSCRPASTAARTCGPTSRPIHLVVDLGSLEDYPTNTIPGFVDGLIEALPGLARHSCSRGPPRRLPRAAQGGHLARARRRARRPAAAAGGRPRHPPRQDPGHRRARASTTSSTGTSTSRSACAAGTLAVRLVNHLVRPDPEFDFAAELETFLLQAAAHRVRPVDAGDPRRGGVARHPVAAAQRALPGAARPGRPPAAHPRHDDVEHLGAGRRHRRRQGADHPAARGRRPAGAAVRVGAHASSRPSGSPNRIGYPVVCKPLDGNHGRGVMLDLQDADEVRAAFPTAQEESRRGWVVVESFITGKDYRVLVIGGRMVALAERVPAHVIGDGSPHRARAGRRDQRRPAARGRPREGADPDQGRRRGGRAGPRAGLRDGRRARPRAPWSSSR